MASNHGYNPSWNMPHRVQHYSKENMLTCTHRWNREVAGILISLAALAGIVALLSVLDDRPQPT